MAWRYLASLLASLVVLVGLGLLVLAAHPQRRRRPFFVLEVMAVAYGLYLLLDAASTAFAVAYSLTSANLYREWGVSVHRLWPLGEAALTLFLFLWFRFALAFPEEMSGRAPSRRLAVAVDVLGLAMAAEMAANLFRYREVALGPWRVAQTNIYLAHWAIVLVVALAGIVQLMRKYLGASSILAKRGLKCVVWSMVAALFIALLFEAPLLNQQRLVDLVPALENLPIAILIFAVYHVARRYHSLSIDLWISRATLYALVVVLLAAVYVVAVVGLSLLFSPAEWTPMLAARHWVVVAVALACLPLWRVAQSGLDRLFRRERYDYRAIMKTLSSRLNGSLDLNAVCRAVVGVVRESLRCQRVCLFLVEESAGRAQICEAVGLALEDSTGLSLRADEIGEILPRPGVPLLLEGESKVGNAPAAYQVLARLPLSLWLPLYKERQLVGLLGVGDREPIELCSPEDVDLLASIANQAAIAIVNAQLYARVQSLTAALQQKVEEQTQVLRQANQELRRLHQEAERLSITDGLTDLYNYRFFCQRLREELERARRHGYPLSVIFLDVDKLKAINDEHGHLTGDAALRHIARLLQSETRVGDAAARYGGDEFVLILPHTTRGEAERVASRLLQRLREGPLQRQGGRLLTLSASLGLATYPEDGITEHDLLARADHNLYANKRRLALPATSSTDVEGTHVICPVPADESSTPSAAIWSAPKEESASQEALSQ